LELKRQLFRQNLLRSRATTQIYAKIIDQKKIDAVNMMDRFFDKDRQA
jgi:hypothetical protein